MKRAGNLYPSICTFENLYLAYQKARKGKRKNANVARFEVNLEAELFRLQEELLTQQYCPGRYHTFMIYDPKERMISAAPFRDRVVHHALCNIIEPILEPTFIHDTYANRKGKGTHAAVHRCQKFARKYPYVLKCDIRKYFPSIDHAILKQLIRRKIKCQQTLQLIDLIIDRSNPQLPIKDYHAGDDLFAITRRKGLPMGNLTSQFFANLYLSPLDHFVKEALGIKGYIRYVDDFLLFGKEKQGLHRAKQKVINFLSSHLRLYLHLHKSQIFPSSQGIPFLGQYIFHNYRLIRKENIRRFYRRTKHRIKRFYQRHLSSEKLAQQLQSWFGHIGQADSHGLRVYVIRLVRRHFQVLERLGGGLLVV